MALVKNDASVKISATAPFHQLTEAALPVGCHRSTIDHRYQGHVCAEQHSFFGGRKSKPCSTSKPTRYPPPTDWSPDRLSPIFWPRGSHQFTRTWPSLQMASRHGWLDQSFGEHNNKGVIADPSDGCLLPLVYITGSCASFLNLAIDNKGGTNTGSQKNISL